MGKPSRDKGKRGERQAAKAIGEHWGHEVRRTRQSDGAYDPDLAGITGVWIEVKSLKRIALHRHYEQAKGDAGGGDIPIVVHKEDRGPWLVTCSVEDLKELAETLWGQHERPVVNSVIVRAEFDDDGTDSNVPYVKFNGIEIPYVEKLG